MGALTAAYLLPACGFQCVAAVPPVPLLCQSRVTAVREWLCSECLCIGWHRSRQRDAHTTGNRRRVFGSVSNVHGCGQMEALGSLEAPLLRQSAGAPCDEQ